MSFEARLAELKIELPPAPKPVASYVPAVRADDLLFLSGTGPFKDGKIVYAGKLGKDLTVEQGYVAANGRPVRAQRLGLRERARLGSFTDRTHYLRGRTRCPGELTAQNRACYRWGIGRHQ